MVLTVNHHYGYLCIDGATKLLLLLIKDLCPEAWPIGGNAATQRGNIAAPLQALHKAINKLDRQVLHSIDADVDRGLQNLESGCCSAALPEIGILKKNPSSNLPRIYIILNQITKPKIGLIIAVTLDHDETNDSENRKKVPIAACDNGLFHSGIFIVTTGCGVPEPGVDPNAS